MSNIPNFKIVGSKFNGNMAVTNSGKQTFTQSVGSKTNLADIASKIDKLIVQSDKISLNVTEIERIDYINQNVTPKFKERTINAIKAGGESVFDEFFLESKSLKVAKAVIKAWLKDGKSE
jgi:Fe-S cluster assembly iron-binding protein IscA